MDATAQAEMQRLAEDCQRQRNWKRWGPYLSERQWATVREDYSANGDCWRYFPHEQARARAYRWGEDGLLGITDRECRLCFALALWNGRDEILKERLFGLTAPEGNHGEDVKEVYFYLDSTPTHSFMEALYKYPQQAFPYTQLVEENHRRTRKDPEFEIQDTGIFDDNQYFDVIAQYAKEGPDDILIRITVANRGAAAARIDVLPTLWFRNTWSWGPTYEGKTPKPSLEARGAGRIEAHHATLGEFVLEAEAMEQGSEEQPELLFTENDTNMERVFGLKTTGYSKDAFHRYVVCGEKSAVNPAREGTKAAAWYRLHLPAGGKATIRLRLYARDETPQEVFGEGFEAIFTQRKQEADAFYAWRTPPDLSDEERRIMRQAYAGLLWSKQFYCYIIPEWIKGDPAQPAPPAGHATCRNADWPHVFSRDVLVMPDKWEYPWFAAWDHAFEMLPVARIDPTYAKDQLLLFLREWYLHPNGQMPAYEFAFSDVNPPVHAWACWRVYKMTGERGQRDVRFLARTFQKLLLNFTWWVNRKDFRGKHLFAGGFLGLDNIGLFDRSQPLPNGAHLEQADGTAWMAFYCGTMLSMALELAKYDSAYEDIASKFFEHFVAITDAMNSLGGTGLWDDNDGFYYDQVQLDGSTQRLKIRSLVGLIPLIACEVLEKSAVSSLPGFHKRMEWFLENRRDLARYITYMEESSSTGHAHYLLAIPSRERLVRVLSYMLDEREFLSPFGLRSLSQIHRTHPFRLAFMGGCHTIAYEPGEAQTPLFGGNSNWRGPVWWPINYLIIEALERYHHFYGERLQVECPTGSGRKMNLQQVARELARRLVALFLPDGKGQRPCFGNDPRFARDPHWKNCLLFHEYFHGQTGQGLGASHQTGWTALVTRCIEMLRC